VVERQKGWRDPSATPPCGGVVAGDAPAAGPRPPAATGRPNREREEIE
jgi:hypothetical protein